MELQQACENGKQGDEVMSAFRMQGAGDIPNRALLLRLRVMTAGKDD